jgi:hypothetical protein
LCRADGARPWALLHHRQISRFSQADPRRSGPVGASAQQAAVLSSPNPAIGLAPPGARRAFSPTRLARWLPGSVLDVRRRREGGRSVSPWAIAGIVAFGLAVLVLCIVAVACSWSPEAWTALATWVTAGVAAAAGVVALSQLGEARRPRVEQAQPYVVVSMELSAPHSKAIDLVVKNLGKTAAMNVRLAVEPKPVRAAGAGRLTSGCPSSCRSLCQGRSGGRCGTSRPRGATPIFRSGTRPS